MIKLDIDVTKIIKDQLKDGRFLKVLVSENKDRAIKYGNTHSASQEYLDWKAAKEQNLKTLYIGNGVDIGRWDEVKAWRDRQNGVNPQEQDPPQQQYQQPQPEDDISF